MERMQAALVKQWEGVDGLNERDMSWREGSCGTFHTVATVEAVLELGV